MSTLSLLLQVVSNKWAFDWLYRLRSCKEQNLWWKWRLQVPRQVFRFRGTARAVQFLQYQMSHMLNNEYQLSALPFNSRARSDIKNVQLRWYVWLKQSDNVKLQVAHMSSFMQDVQEHWELLHILRDYRQKDFEPSSGPVSMQLKILQLRYRVMSKLRLHMQNMQHIGNKLHKLQRTKVQSYWQ